MIYISGRISNEPNYKEHFNRIEKIIKEIGDGENVFNPSSIDLGTGATWADYLRIDIKVLLECSTIVMLEGWEGSRGALLEWNIARAMDMKIIYENELP